ncbi:hypothetical protein A9261_15190 [Vibrio tasmaniensis]|nr:hypothetical protein A9261_15190 [Vibrio tasmaniensis]
MIKKDITSALTVSFLTIAAGAAFGIWTGVGSLTGILSMAVASVVGFLFGGIPVKTSGPTGPTAGLMYAGVIALAEASADPGVYAHILAISAVIIFLLSFFPIQKILSHLPYVSLAIFVNGISLFIIYKQLVKAIDLSSNVWELSIIFGTIMILFLWPRISKILNFIPGHSVISGAVFVMALGGTLNAIFTPEINTLSIEALSLDIIFAKMRSLFTVPDIPLLLGTTLIMKTVFIVSLVTTVTARALDKDVTLSRELRNQALANASVSLVSGIPVTIGFIRTRVLQRAGGNSPFAGIFTGIFVTIIIIYLQGMLELIPTSVFIGILIKAGYSSLDLQVWHDYKSGNGSLVSLLFVATGSILIIWQDLVFVFIGSVIIWNTIQLHPSFKRKSIDLKNCPCVG